VGELSFLERESGLQVSLQEGSLFDDGNQMAVDGFLIGSLRVGESPRRPLDLVGSFRKFSTLNKLEVRMLGFPCLLLLFARFFEILVVDLGIELQAGDVDLGGGRNDVSLIDASKRNSIDGIGTSDKEKARIELFQKHHSVRLETTGEDDENGSRSDIFPQTRGAVVTLPRG